MNTENLKTLIAALRSGRYIQGHGQLARRRQDGTIAHCCLGVACVEAGLEAVPLGAGWQFEQNLIALPASARAWLRVQASNPRLHWPPNLRDRQGYTYRDNDAYSMAGLNDSGFTFDQIADLLDYFGIDYLGIEED